MIRFLRWQTARVLALALLGWVFAGAAGARAEAVAGVTNPKEARDAWVSDMAGVISDDTERQINAVIDNLDARTSAEIAVVTIRRTDGETPKDFATALFNRWGIGKKGKDNGILVLLVLDARRVEVETGYGVEGDLPDSRVGGILQAQAVPRFRQGDYGGGLLAVTRQLASILGGGSPAPPSPGTTSGGAGRSAPPYRPPLRFPRPEPEPYPWHLPLGVAVLLLGPLIAYAVWRSNIRHCDCGKRMRRLTEEQDDAYLSRDQKTEEDLGAVDWRAWRCDACQKHRIEPRRSWRFSDCPGCKRHTVKVQSSTVIRQPTYERTGLRRVVRTCRFPGCKHRDVENEVIPKRVRSTSSGSSWSSSGSDWSSSSSSSGSFGGGSSGGGGAGASW